MNKKPYSQILDSVARDHMAGSTDLAPRVLSRIQRGNHFKMRPRTSFFVAILLVLLAFATLFFTIPGMAAAIQGWFGYVPGVGLVSAGQIRGLASPVTVTRDGITVTVEQLFLEADSIELTYKAVGIPASAFIHSNPPDACQKSMQATLRFPGWELDRQDTAETRTTGLEGGYEVYDKFSVTPPLSNDAVFVLPCLYNVRAGAAPEDWEIPLHFVPSPPRLTVFPVTELPTQTVPVATPTPQVSATPELSGIFLTLDRLVKLADADQIYATLHWENTHFNAVDVDQTAIHVRDAGGQEVPFTYVEDENLAADNDQHHRVFAVKVPLSAASGPLTVVVDFANVESINLPADAGFTFDPSAKPLPAGDPRIDPLGLKTWLLNQDVRLGARSLRVVSASVDASGQVNFNMTSDTGIIAAYLFDAHQVGNGGGGGESIGSGGPFTEGIDYGNALPAGPVHISIASITFHLDGPWQALWTPAP